MTHTAGFQETVLGTLNFRNCAISSLIIFLAFHGIQFLAMAMILTQQAHCMPLSREHSDWRPGCIDTVVQNLVRMIVDDYTKPSPELISNLEHKFKKFFKILKSSCFYCNFENKNQFYTLYLKAETKMHFNLRTSLSRSDEMSS